MAIYQVFNDSFTRGTKATLSSPWVTLTSTWGADSGRFEIFVDENEGPVGGVAPEEIPEHSTVYSLCTCGCGCEADGDWHFNEKFCACRNLGCPCVSDAPGEPTLLESS